MDIGRGGMEREGRGVWRRVMGRGDNKGIREAWERKVAKRRKRGEGRQG